LLTVSPDAAQIATGMPTSKGSVGTMKTNDRVIGQERHDELAPT